MCGITGAVGIINTPIHLAVKSMQQAMTHRGPDGEGTWSSPEDGIILAHRRLAIIDLSEQGAQPMLDERNGNAISFNGEVYNYQEIRLKLEEKGVQFHSHTDTEVILKAYAEWGMDCIKHLRGMFALAIWDANKKRLQLIRDRVGIKPLYYARILNSGKPLIIFASELRAILASGLIEKKINPAGVASYIWNGFVSGSGTIIQNIQLLPAGCFISLDPSDLNILHYEQYWQFPDSNLQKTQKHAIDNLETQLQESVKLRLISDVPLGVFLSGGIDSSAIAGLASSLSNAPIHTFNIGFEESEYDESKIAAAVAKALGTQHTCIRISENDFKNQLDDALGCLDQPSFDAINTYFVSRAVREAGMTVALAGVGGDELFGGYRSFLDIPLSTRWASRTSWLSDDAIHDIAGLIMKIKGVSTKAFGTFKSQTRWGKLSDALCARSDLLNTYQISYGLFTQEFINELLPSKNETISYGLSQEKADGLRNMLSSMEGSSILHKISSLELANFVGERLLRDIDAASMAVSLEVRVPLLDHEVINATAKINNTTRYLPLGKKQLLKNIALDRLDPSLFNRPKSGFVLPIDSWCRKGLGRRVGEVLNNSTACEAIGLNPFAVSRLWDAFKAGHPGVYWSRIWAIFIILNWCDEHNATI